MTWVTPSAGLLLGAIVIPLLLLLYFLRLRRRPLRISSTMLWERAVEDLHANTPFQRLRSSTLLLLQLIALVLVVLALMQPQIEGGSPREGTHIILIDRSGSMEAVDVDGITRLAIAKEKASDLVNQIYGGGLFSSSSGETMVISFSDHAEVVAPFTDSKQQLLHAIESIQPTHGKSSISEPLKLARAYTTNVDPEQDGISSSEFAQLELFSDGLIDDIQDQALQGGETLQYHMIGSPLDKNIGISTIDAKRSDESSDDVQVFLSLVNTNSKDETVEIELQIDGVPVGVQEVQIPKQSDGLAGTSSLVFVPFSMPQSGVIEARLLLEDSLAIDNHASLIIPPAKELKVLVAEEGAQIVRTVLQGMPLADLKVVTSSKLKTMIESGESYAYDVVVIRNIPLDTLPRGKYLIFGEPPPIAPFDTFAEGEAQVMLVASENHPVMRFVRYEDIVVTKGHDVVLQNAVDTLLEGSNWPAVMTYRGDGIHLVYIAFDPIDSNWPYLRSFPFFVFNGIQFLGHTGDQLTASTTKIGQTITENIREEGKATLEEPDGTTHTILVDKSGNVSWGPVRLSGVHTISSDNQSDSLISINSPHQESMIASTEKISIGAKEVVASSSGGLSFIQLWPWALGAVLVVLFVEWWVYQKKVSTPLRLSWTQGGNERKGIR